MKSTIKIFAGVLVLVIVTISIKIAFATAPICTVGQPSENNKKVDENGHCRCTDGKDYTLYKCVDQPNSTCSEVLATSKCV